MPETDFNDEYAGQGGNYTADPKTGKRTLVQRTEDRSVGKQPSQPDMTGQGVPPASDSKPDTQSAADSAAK